MIVRRSHSLVPHPLIRPRHIRNHMRRRALPHSQRHNRTYHHALVHAVARVDERPRCAGG
jgi:hypothetical protein